MSELRYVFRAFRKSPGFTALAVLTLGLGVGATTAIFSLVNAVLLRPLPVPEAERLVSVQEMRERGEVEAVLSLPGYLDYRDRAAGLSGLAAHHIDDITLNTGDVSQVGLALYVSGNYFDQLRLGPALGRLFGEEEARTAGTPSVAVISHALWQERFGGDPSAVGRVIHVNGQPLTVIGVAPAGFPGTMLGARPPVYLPLGLYDRLNLGSDSNRRGREWLMLFGRLAPGTSREQAEAALTVTARQLADVGEYLEGLRPTGVRLQPFSLVPPMLHRGVAGFMTLLLATASLVALIAAVNVAGMLLTRGVARSRDIAIRLAIGASRRRVVQQLVFEGLVLAIGGAVLGVLLASWVAAFLETVRPPSAEMFRLDLALDPMVLGFGMAVSLAAGLLAGLVPARQASRPQLATALKEGSAGAGARNRLRLTLVAGQLALSVLLLVATGLFLRTLQRALDTPHGFEPRGVLAMELNLRLNGYDEPRGRVFYDGLLERVRALPGVEAASLTGNIPLSGSWDQTRFRIPGLESPDPSGFPVGFILVGSGYFETLRMPLLAGRGFTPQDASSMRPVLVINETLARRFWPNESPIGKRVQSGPREAEVVGVVSAGKYRGFAEEPVLFAYFPFGQAYQPSMWLQVRVRGEMAPVAAAIRGELRVLDPNVAPIQVTTVEDVLGSSLFAQRLGAVLVGSFGLVGLTLAAVGLFGVLSLAVVQRTREIGIRMALGAGRGEVLRLVFRDAARPLALGVGLGLLAALPAAQLLRGLLHGLNPADLATFTAVPAVFAVVALIAAYAPARRALRVDPMTALRYE
ncbi:MAG TPA: ABC transporter permease [Gemmatimonadales bacterium]|nr:ABC transporter permease [Gemmatimonadales bacterium]